MGRATLSLFAAICFIGVAQGTKCSTGPGYRFPITCPGLLDSTKNHCCEISGSFRCCDEEEFARQDGTNDISKPPLLRHKRGWGGFFRGLARASRSENRDSNSGATWGIAGVGIILCVLYYSYRCCACCPCSNTRHEDDTNVTTDQPAANCNIGNNTQNNFYLGQPNHGPSQSTMLLNRIVKWTRPMNYYQARFSKFSEKIAQVSTQSDQEEDITSKRLLIPNKR